MVPSPKPILVIPFRNGELYCCHLDGFGNDVDSLQKRLAQIEDTFTPHITRRVWWNVDDTVLDEVVLDVMVCTLSRIQSSIVKIAFVGVGKRKRALDKFLRSSGFQIPREFFDDAGLAKEWLL